LTWFRFRNQNFKNRKANHLNGVQAPQFILKSSSQNLICSMNFSVNLVSFVHCLWRLWIHLLLVFFFLCYVLWSNKSKILFSIDFQRRLNNNYLKIYFIFQSPKTAMKYSKLSISDIVNCKRNVRKYLLENK